MVSMYAFAFIVELGRQQKPRLLVELLLPHPHVQQDIIAVLDRQLVRHPGLLSNPLNHQGTKTPSRRCPLLSQESVDKLSGRASRRPLERRGLLSPSGVVVESKGFLIFNGLNGTTRILDWPARSLKIPKSRERFPVLFEGLSPSDHQGTLRPGGHSLPASDLAHGCRRRTAGGARCCRPLPDRYRPSRFQCALEGEGSRRRRP